MTDDQVKADILDRLAHYDYDFDEVEDIVPSADSPTQVWNCLNTLEAEGKVKWFRHKGAWGLPQEGQHATRTDNR